MRDALATLRPTLAPSVQSWRSSLSVAFGFPVTLLIVATAAAFGRWPGHVFAFVGRPLRAPSSPIRRGLLLGSQCGAAVVLGPRLIRVRRVIAASGISRSGRPSRAHRPVSRW